MMKYGCFQYTVPFKKESSVEHRKEDVLEEGTSKIKNEGAITYLDDRIVLLICAIGVTIDIVLIMGIVSCVRHIAKWFVPY